MNIQEILVISNIAFIVGGLIAGGLYIALLKKQNKQLVQMLYLSSLGSAQIIIKHETYSSYIDSYQPSLHLEAEELSDDKLKQLQTQILSGDTSPANVLEKYQVELMKIKNKLASK